MKLRTVSDGRAFRAQLHFAVYDDTDYLVAASFADFDTTVRAMSSSIIEGREATIVQDNHPPISLKCLSGDYKRVIDGKEDYHSNNQKRDTHNPIVSCVVMAKASVFNENHEVPVIIAPDGDIARAVGKFLIARFALPDEWEGEYINLIPPQDIEELKVLVNPLNKSWSNLKSVRLSRNVVNQDYIINEIDSRLKAGMLNIPPDPFEQKCRVEADQLKAYVRQLKHELAGLQANNAPTEEIEKKQLEFDENLQELVSKEAQIQRLHGKFDPSWDMKEYMRQNAETLAEKLRAVRPRFVPGVDPLSPWIARQSRIPFPAQAFDAQAIINTLRSGQRDAFDVGDMGTGKSATSLTVAHVLHKEDGFNKVLLVAPGITVPKWIKEEIMVQIPYARVRVLRNSREALEYYRMVKAGYQPKGLEITLVGTDRAKLGPQSIWCSAVWKRVKGEKFHAWHCPDCGEALLDPDAEFEGTWAFWDTLMSSPKPTSWYGPKNANGLPVSYVPEVKWKKAFNKCQHCGDRGLLDKQDPKKTKNPNGKLWRPANKSRGEALHKHRWFICRILKKLGKHFDLLIMDEVHQSKSGSTGRGDSYHQLLRAAKKVLNLTGTLVNGKSTSIKEILWKVAPREQIEKGYSHKTGPIAWAKDYGVLKKITRVTEEDVGITTRQKQTEYQPTEEPGISPSMVAEFILHRATFRGLENLGLPLVELNEIPVIVEFDQGHGRDYRAFHESLMDKCKALSRLGAKGAWSKFIPATINYADCPHLGGFVKFGKDDTATVITAPTYPEDYYHAKEMNLLGIVAKELREGRKVAIFCSYTDTYGVHKRLQKVLADNDIKSSVLTSAVPSEKRVEWLEKQLEGGCQVLIANMRLLEVGLNLIDFSSLILYQLSYDINTIRQIARRHWRIGAYRECRVYYMLYNLSQQLAQFENIMIKRAHALMTEGRLDKSELANYGRDAHNAMAVDLANCLASSELADKWTELAKKDIDSNLWTVSEAEFKDALKKAMKDLAEETRRLCGVAGEGMAQGEVIDITPIAVEERIEPVVANIQSGQISFADMWANVAVEAPKLQKKKKKVDNNHNQLSLFDFGAGFGMGA